MTTENNKLLDYSETSEIDIEEFKAIANSLNASDSLSRRLVVIKQLTDMLHKEIWRIAGVIIKRSCIQEVRVRDLENMRIN